MSPDGSSILFRHCPAGLDRRRLRSFHRRLESEVAGGPFNCLLARDAVLRDLNQRFLGHDYATDVLSFPSPDCSQLGEIAISVDRAADQATRYGHAVEDEIAILMLHGALHLTGMDHERDRGTMARAEKKWRLTLGLPGSLIQRARTGNAS